VRAKEPNAFGMKFLRQPIGDFVQQRLINCSDGTQGNVADLLMGSAQWIDVVSQDRVPRPDILGEQSDQRVCSWSVRQVGHG